LTLDEKRQWIVEKIENKAQELGLGEVNVRFVEEKAATLGQVFAIPHRGKTIHLTLTRRDLTGLRDRERMVDERIESALQILSQQQTDLGLLETPHDLPEE